MKSFVALISWLSDRLKHVGAFCLTGMMVLTCVDVVGRFFNKPILGAIEIVGFFATLTTALALPYTHQMDAHIGVELLVSTLSEKKQKRIRMATTLVSMILFAIVAWRMMVYADTIHQSGEVSMTMKLPEYLIIYLVAFCFFVFFLTLLKDVLGFFQHTGNK
jgi:TRAP-type C4-dicarboxylate transport system permease small subunit